MTASSRGMRIAARMPTDPRELLSAGALEPHGLKACLSVESFLTSQAHLEADPELLRDPAHLPAPKNLAVLGCRTFIHLAARKGHGEVGLRWQGVLERLSRFQHNATELPAPLVIPEATSSTGIGEAEDAALSKLLESASEMCRNYASEPAKLALAESEDAALYGMCARSLLRGRALTTDGEASLVYAPGLLLFAFHRLGRDRCEAIGLALGVNDPEPEDQSVEWILEQTAVVPPDRRPRIQEMMRASFLEVHRTRRAVRVWAKCFAGCPDWVSVVTQLESLRTTLNISRSRPDSIAQWVFEKATLDMARCLPDHMLSLMCAAAVPLSGNRKFVDEFLARSASVNSLDEAQRIVAQFLDQTGTLTTFELATACIEHGCTFRPEAEPLQVA